MTKRVVFVCSETTKSKRYLTCFETRGFRVESANTRQLAKKQFDTGEYDLAVVDVDLGQNDRDGGFQLCRELRTYWPTLPIILLGKQDSEVDQLSAYRLGADEFLSEFIKPDYLVARCHALLARLALFRETAIAEGDISRGRLRIERPTLCAFWDGQAVSLKVKQLRMLIDLVEAEGETRSVNQLMQAAKIQVQPNTITASVARMRRSFRVIDPMFDAIENVHGQGYRWIG